LWDTEISKVLESILETTVKFRGDSNLPEIQKSKNKMKIQILNIE